MLGKVLDAYHLLVTETVGDAVTAIVHDEGSLLHLLLHESRHVRIAVARRGGGTLVGVPVYLLDVEGGIHLLGHADGSIGLTHVHVAVAVVAHEAERVLPVAGIAVLHIVVYLIDQNLGLLFGTSRQTAYAHVGFVALGQASSLAFIEQAEIVVADVAVGGAVGVFTLVAEQEVVGRALGPVDSEHAVVPGTIAEEQQIAGHVGLGLGTIVEHLQIAAIGVGIGGSAAELVKELVGRHDAHSQGIVLLVQLLQPLGLSTHFLRRGNDDDHIGSLVGMMILIGDAIDQLRRGKLVGRKTGGRSSCRHGQRQIVESHRGIAGLLPQTDGVAFAKNALQVEGDGLNVGLRGLGNRRCDIHAAHHRIVHLYAHRSQSVVGHHHRQHAARVVSRQLVGGVCVSRHRRLLEEVPPAVVPGKLLSLMQRVIVIGGGIESRHKGGTIYGERLVVALSEEIAALCSVRIADAGSSRSTAPPYGTHTVEQASSANDACGHLLQVVGSSQIVGRQHLGLQGSTIAVNLHLVYIREASLAYQSLGQLIDARLRNTDLNPLTRRKHGMGGIVGGKG